MSSQYEYEVVWDGTHQGQNADLLIAGELDRQYQVYKDRPVDVSGAAKAVREGFGRGRRKTPIERFCIECGQQFAPRWPKEGWKHGGRMFCNAKCQSLHKSRHNTKWRTKIGDKAWHAWRSRYALRRSLPAQPCEVCGTSERIHRHHRDHDPFNNAITNIAFLCEPHHIELHRREANEQPF